MMMAPGLDRLSILIEQSRYVDAESLARQLITDQPTVDEYKYYLTVALQRQGKLTEADKMADVLLGSDPSEALFVELKADLDIDQERLVEAESKLKGLLQREVIKERYYLLLCKIKFRQNNYDKAMYYVEQALEMDPEDIDALNMRSAIANIIGDERVDMQVEEALSMDPNNSYSIANHGTQLLNEGKVTAAMERFKEALAIEPENTLAQYGLMEAMKSRFWPYRLLYNYGLFMSRLSGKGNWGVIIGAYILYRLVIRTAESNPELKMILYPIAGLMFLAFISSWILAPLMNFVLLTNKYGKLLLDEDEKKSAMLTGFAFVLMLISLLCWVLVGTEFMLVALTFLLMMIPLGTMFGINGTYEKSALLWGYGLTLFGSLGIVGILLFNNYICFGIFAVGMFVFQFLMNKWVISTYGRTFGE